MSRQLRALALVVVLLLMLSPAIVQAHAELVRSEPLAGALLAQPPTEVRLWFSEPIEPEFYAIEVYGPDGTRVDRGDTQIPADDITALVTNLQQLRPDTYTVSWRVLSIDGHVVQGTFTFTIGTLPPAPAPALELPDTGPPFELGATVRWWSFLLSFALAGGLAFLPLVLWPALRAAGLDEEAPARRAARGLLWVGWPAIALLFGLNLVLLLLQAAQVTGLPLGEVLDSRAITRLLTRTRYGTWWVMRFGLLAALLAVITALTVEVRPGQGRIVRWAGLAAATGLLATYSLGGHASGVPERIWLAVLADWLHLVAGAVWIGGLLQLLLGLLPALLVLDQAERRVLLARAIQRFSLLAGGSVAVLIGTGVYAGLLHVPSWQALAETAYGAALSGKLVLFSPLLLLGAINLLVLHPRFVRAAGAHLEARRGQKARTQPESTPDSSRVSRANMGLFRWIVVGEIGLAILVLAVTGLLTGFPPATSAPGEAEPFRATQPAGSLQVTLAVDPNEVGENQLLVSISDAGGRPIDEAQVGIILQHQDMAMGERQVVAQPSGQGRYETSGNFLNMEGRWAANVRVLQAGTEATTTFRFSAGSPPGSGAARPVLSPARILLNADLTTTAVGLFAVVLAILLFVHRTGVRRARDRRMAALVGAALGLVGTFVTGAALTSAYQATLPNPFPATEISVAAGRQIYGPNCASCHGPTGRGDGPAGIMLRPRPADFRVHMAAGHTDAQLFDWIAQGVDGTGMPSFRDQLTDEEIWNVVNYIRTFAPSGRGTR